MADKKHGETFSALTSRGGILYGRRSIFGFIYFFINAVLWPLLRKGIFAPVTVFVVAVYSALEKFLRARKNNLMCVAHQAAAKIAQAQASRLAGIVLLTSIVAVLFTTSVYSFGIEVIIDGESFGYVKNREEYTEVLTQVQSRISRIMGTPHSVSADVTFSFGVVPRDKFLSHEKLEQILYSKIQGLEQLYAVSVNGKVVGACTSEAGAKQALALLTLSTDQNIKREIASDVAISYEAVDASLLCTPEELVERMRQNETRQTIHVIEKGDTVRGICSLYNMERADLKELNPEMNMSKLVVGQELVVSKAFPVVSLKEYRHVTETVSIPFETVKVKDSSMYVGKSTVKTNGVEGSKQVVADVTYVDGEIVERTVVSETVLSESVDKVVLVGSKPLPKKAATGTFRKPTDGATITSYYGWRRSGFHTGVDFALPMGSPIYAADGGTVSFSGWKGGYGYLVIINHGNGKQTYYAHNSKLLVSRGDKVGKGEQIAKMGSTGNSTGPHVHFEIRVDGKHVNPMRYLS